MSRLAVPNFGDELRISPKPAIALLLIPAILLPLVTQNLFDPSRTLDAALLLYPLVVTLWLVDRWNTQVARWAMVITLAIGMYIFRAWFDIPGFLVLLVIPTALATTTLGSRATTTVAIGESLFLGLFSKHLVLDNSRMELTIAIIAIWATVGIMYAAYQPVLQLARWSWEHYERARRLLEEARDRQVELKDALDALAQANRQLSLANQNWPRCVFSQREQKRPKRLSWPTSATSFAPP